MNEYHFVYNRYIRYTMYIPQCNLVTRYASKSCFTEAYLFLLSTAAKLPFNLWVHNLIKAAKKSNINYVLINTLYIRVKWIAVGYIGHMSNTKLLSSYVCVIYFPPFSGAQKRGNRTSDKEKKNISHHMISFDWLWESHSCFVEKEDK